MKRLILAALTAVLPLAGISAAHAACCDVMPPHVASAPVPGSEVAVLIPYPLPGGNNVLVLAYPNWIGGFSTDSPVAQAIVMHTLGR